MDAKSALNAVNEVRLSAVELANCQELTYYIVFSAGVTAGAVQCEESHDDTFTGAWAPNGSPAGFASNTVKTVKVAGVSQAQQVRISTGITDGTVSVWVIGRG